MCPSATSETLSTYTARMNFEGRRAQHLVGDQDGRAVPAFSGAENDFLDPGQASASTQICISVRLPSIRAQRRDVAPAGAKQANQPALPPGGSVAVGGWIELQPEHRAARRRS